MSTENKHTQGKVDNNLNDGNVYCGGIVIANCYSSFIGLETIKANAKRIATIWNEYDSLKELNRELIEALETSREYISHYGKPVLGDNGQHLALKRISTILTKAQSLQP